MVLKIRFICPITLSPFFVVVGGDRLVGSRSCCSMFFIGGYGVGIFLGSYLVITIVVSLEYVLGLILNVGT